MAVDEADAADWVAITRRNARSVQTTIGWIFWDPGVSARAVALGMPAVPSLRTGTPNSRGPRIVSVPLPAAREGMVLRAADTAAAVGWGWEQGIALFEGRLLRPRGG